MTPFIPLKSKKVNNEAAPHEDVVGHGMYALCVTCIAIGTGLQDNHHLQANLREYFERPRYLHV